ncbi:MAG: GGDEF domain-containing protein [Pseudomonadota bacterium]
MFSGVTVSIDLAVLALIVLCAASMGAMASHTVARLRGMCSAYRERRAGNAAIKGLFRSGSFTEQCDEIANRPTLTPARANARPDTLLHARVDHLREVGQIWGADTRRSAIEQVADIMKRSVRGSEPSDGVYSDVVTQIRGEGFTILVRGAEEAHGGAIAKRLRRELARAQIEGLADNLRLTASFGVAGRRMGESFAAWRARAQSALDAAQSRGEDQIVEASVVEEIKLLPAPASASAGSKAKAA